MKSEIAYYENKRKYQGVLNYTTPYIFYGIPRKHGISLQHFNIFYETILLHYDTFLNVEFLFKLIENVQKNKEL